MAVFHCNKYCCDMAPEACAIRQTNSAGSKMGARHGYKPGAQDYNCRDCPQGKKVAAGLSTDQIDEYRMDLKRTRMSCLFRHMHQAKAKPYQTVSNRVNADQGVTDRNTGGQTMSEKATPTAAAPAKICSRGDCSHGGQPQPLADFDNNKKTKDGKSSYCKDCRREKQSLSREKKRNTLNAIRQKARETAEQRKEAVKKADLLDKAAVIEPAAAAGDGGHFAALATSLARQGHTHDQLREIAALCTIVGQEIDIYLRLHRMFGGQKELKP
jgi:hypothetical protein